ncbi:hypothetical protein [Halalkalicoccus tibetensis]|uniref:Uncharacterized protein n=1 Tax=Halalkalicoccus tibetensis TaxID=175632 RepID=A0ABD5V5H0_9EURY
MVNATRGEIRTGWGLSSALILVAAVLVGIRWPPVAVWAAVPIGWLLVLGGLVAIRRVPMRVAELWVGLGIAAWALLYVVRTFGG